MSCWRGIHIKIHALHFIYNHNSSCIKWSILVNRAHSIFAYFGSTIKLFFGFVQCYSTSEMRATVWWFALSVTLPLRLKNKVYGNQIRLSRKFFIYKRLQTCNLDTALILWTIQRNYRLYWAHNLKNKSIICMFFLRVYYMSGNIILQIFNPVYFQFSYFPFSVHSQRSHISSYMTIV